MDRVPRTLIPLLLALAAPGAAAQPAAAKIAFQCGANLCLVGDDGLNRRPLTTDGAPGKAYLTPSLSRDGLRLSYVREQPGSGIVVANAGSGSRTIRPSFGPNTLAPRLRPDGGAVLWSERKTSGDTAVFVLDLLNPASK